MVISVPDNSSTSSTGKLPAEAATVYLLIDADGDFSSGATEYIMKKSSTNRVLTGVDLDDGQFFTFATNNPPAPG